MCFSLSPSRYTARSLSACLPLILIHHHTQHHTQTTHNTTHTPHITPYTHTGDHHHDADCEDRPTRDPTNDSVLDSPAPPSAPALRSPNKYTHATLASDLADDERAERLAEQNKNKPSHMGNYEENNPNNYPVRTIQYSDMSECTASTPNSARSEISEMNGILSVNSSPKTLNSKKSGRNVSFSQSLGIGPNYHPKPSNNNNRSYRYCYPDDSFDYPPPKPVGGQESETRGKSLHRGEENISPPLPPPHYGDYVYQKDNFNYNNDDDMKSNINYHGDLTSTYSNAYEPYSTPQEKNRRAISSFVEGSSVGVNNF